MLKPGVHTNDFAPIHRLRALKLGHASLATVFRPGRLTLQPILRENLESPVLRYQPITTAVVTDACLNTRWHHGAYTSAVLRESLGLDRVVTVYAELSRPDWLATVQSGRKQVQSRVCTPSFTNTYEYLAIILRSLRLVANCVRKPIHHIFATIWRICRKYIFVYSQGYSPQCETSIRECTGLGQYGMKGERRGP